MSPKTKAVAIQPRSNPPQDLSPQTLSAKIPPSKMPPRMPSANAASPTKTTASKAPASKLSAPKASTPQTPISQTPTPQTPTSNKPPPKNPKKNPLGRSLASLLGGEGVAASEAMAGAAAMRGENRSMLVATEKLKPNPNQPRQRFASQNLLELATSIKQHGILQPILVLPRNLQTGAYEIVAGERRWRAATMAKLAEVPVTVMAKSKDARTASLVENLQREDLNPLEEATAFSALLKLGPYTHQQLAQRLGKSRAYVSNSVRLMELPKAIQQDLTDGNMPAATARLLVGKKDALGLAKVIKSQRLNVRQAEKLVAGKPEVRTQDETLKRWQQLVSEALGMRVAIKQRATKSKEGKQQEASQKGSFTIYYQSREQLETLVETLSHPLKK